MRLQASGQIAIQLDNGKCVQAFTDRFGQRRQARTDLDNCLPFLGLMAETMLSITN
jgi:hypothetical protein